MYNDSKLNKEQWEEAERLCDSNPILQEIWESYKLNHKGVGKKVVQTMDTFIDFVSEAVKLYCAEDDEFFDAELMVGEQMEGGMRGKVKALMSSKDDKATDRIVSMIKILKDVHLDRKEVFDSLGLDDKEDIAAGSKSGARDLADRSGRKIIVNSEGSSE